MKKEYIRPEIAMEVIITEYMLALSKENMGSNETPGGQDDFNISSSRGEWGTIWK